ncbi:MAG: hypothetical protein A3H98_14485 [Bacteroidetes bacterium RIFCSPLOWO2_02_FULL_36_8]|nr:MAG: hypothetical protein A3H98_14485 [Bacteroidetes bacterium RIFCSPLOWO2_02_FULL_36_8]
MTISCKKEEEKKEAPAIPPASTMQLDASSFDTTKKIMNEQINLRAFPLTKANWLHAAGNVLVWNVVLTVGLAVPVASFYESFNHTASQTSDNVWEWTYGFKALNIDHTAKLRTTLQSDNTVKWEMFISKANSFTDFLWYSGTSDLANSTGTWTLNDNPTSKKALLSITWNRNTTSGTADTKYMNIVPGGVENGGYIHYGITSDATFNAYYKIFNKGKNNLTDIKWNRTTKVGQVTDSIKFKDTQWHCWDAQLNDAVCN